VSVTKRGLQREDIVVRSNRVKNLNTIKACSLRNLKQNVTKISKKTFLYLCDEQSMQISAYCMQKLLGLVMYTVLILFLKHAKL